MPRLTQDDIELGWKDLRVAVQNGDQPFITFEIKNLKRVQAFMAELSASGLVFGNYNDLNTLRLAYTIENNELTILRSIHPSKTFPAASNFSLVRDTLTFIIDVDFGLMADMIGAFNLPPQFNPTLIPLIPSDKPELTALWEQINRPVNDLIASQKSLLSY